MLTEILLVSLLIWIIKMRSYVHCVTRGISLVFAISIHLNIIHYQAGQQIWNKQVRMVRDYNIIAVEHSNPLVHHLIVPLSAVQTILILLNCNLHL